jgi:hypothetical protein
MAVQIQIRRGTAANWTSANPTLAEGELGYETDTGKLKAGDGSTAWTSLDYISGTGALTEVSSDTTPQLGGDLDVNGNSIVSASNGDIAITPNGTGSIILHNLTWPSADGSPDQVLKTDGNGTLSFGAASTVAAIGDLTDVVITSADLGDFLQYNGSNWVDSTIDYSDVTNNVGSGSVDCVSETDVPAGSITEVVALTAAQYADISGGPSSDVLYVITGGTTSIADSDDVTITSADANDFLVVDGGDWVDKTPAQVRAILDLEVGTDVQAYDAELAAIAGLTSAAGKAIEFTGSGTAALFDITTAGKALLDDADAAAQRTTLGLENVKTDSYVGHIETPADGTYYLDPKVAAAREITGVYFAWTAGGSPDGDIDVQIGGTSVLSSTGRMNSGSSFTGTLKTDGTEDVAADAVITVVLGAVNGVADVTDLRFSVEYAQ